MGHLMGVSNHTLVPPGATAITTPLVQVQWQKYLSNHSSNTLVNFFITDISQGFKLCFNKPLSQLKSACKNLSSAVIHPEVIDEYLAAELKKSQIAGPFSQLDIPHAHISRFGVIPKKYSQQWRLIVDLSYPVGFSFNDGIPKDLCSLSNITMDTAVRHILFLGPGSLLAKLDVKSTFCLLPVHVADHHLLAMHWKNQIYIDTCLFLVYGPPETFQ